MPFDRLFCSCSCNSTVSEVHSLIWLMDAYEAIQRFLVALAFIAFVLGIFRWILFLVRVFPFLAVRITSEVLPAQVPSTARSKRKLYSLRWPTFRFELRVSDSLVLIVVSKPSSNPPSSKKVVECLPVPGVFCSNSLWDSCWFNLTVWSNVFAATLGTNIPYSNWFIQPCLIGKFPSNATINLEDHCRPYLRGSAHSVLPWLL